MKKIATFIGNCHNSGMNVFLQKSKQFSETYECRQHTSWQMIKDKKSIPVDDVMNADLFVYQPLAPVHGCYSTDPNVEGSIGTILKDTCTQISYPYTYYSALWPICQAGVGEDQKHRWFGSEAIDSLRLQGANDHEILKMYDKDDINWCYITRHEETLGILRKKESITDVKISKFIEIHLKHRELFLIPQHPTSIVFHEMTNQVLEKLGMDRLPEDQNLEDNEAFLLDSSYGQPSNRWPIHDSAIEFHGLEYTSDHFSQMHAKGFYRRLLIIYMRMFSKNAASEHFRNFEECYTPNDTIENKNILLE